MYLGLYIPSPQFFSFPFHYLYPLRVKVFIIDCRLLFIYYYYCCCCRCCCCCCCRRCLPIPINIYFNISSIHILLKSFWVVFFVLFDNIAKHLPWWEGMWGRVEVKWRGLLPHISYCGLFVFLSLFFFCGSCWLAVLCWNIFFFIFHCNVIWKKNQQQQQIITTTATTTSANTNG